METDDTEGVATDMRDLRVVVMEESDVKLGESLLADLEGLF